MKRIPRKRAIDIVLAGHIYDIEEWILRDRESLKNWLFDTLNLGKMPVENMKEQFAGYFAPYILEDDEWEE